MPPKQSADAPVIKFVKPLHFADALKVAQPDRNAVSGEFKYRGGAEDHFNDYRKMVLGWLQATKMTFFKSEFTADMQNSRNVDKWLGHVPRLTDSQSCCVENALADSKLKVKPPGPTGERFTWELPYIFEQILGSDSMWFYKANQLNPNKQTYEMIEGSDVGQIYFVVILTRKNFGTSRTARDPKKSVVAGGESHIQIFERVAESEDQNYSIVDGIKIIDRQQTKSSALAFTREVDKRYKDVRLLVWKLRP